ncbi:HNH endonuclease signature motif containing protein [Arthrobacter sp. ISL-72]|uniref:HNH endonuclease signature motif containing protein n=1 Tax=Arthrobacter sp. ISL-72 TaxID=2819114 RepID=UPI001BE92D21|nr:HNH endonuclease signature motif containing protein [Arthrobacter sp. ISL-72]MBT2597170.1 DUF222 domain-containing protein [Arthrobacter sp. ISL-72]
MESRAAVVALEGIESSVAALAVCVRGAAGEVAPAGGDPAGVDPVGLDPLRDQADAFLDGLAEVGRMEARLAALKVHLAAGYAAAAEALAAPAKSPQEHTAQEMAVTAEVACVLTVSERTAGALLCEARTLTAGLPLTLAALQAGTISWQHARILCDETANLVPAAAAALEVHFLDPDAVNPARGCPAGELVPGRFRAKARAWRERHHPVSIEARHTKSAADRRLEYVPDRDGMAWLSAYLPADTAAGIWDRATTAARALQGPAEPRTLTQLRVDVAAAWQLGAGNAVDGTGGVDGANRAPAGSGRAGAGRAGDVPSPAAQVLVTVPVFSLLGLTEEPAMLDGYGPIPPSMARRLVADGAASIRRVLTDPRDGAPLEIGRSTYRIPTTLRQWLRLRDGRCPFPGCNNPSLDNDADHLLAWADGGGTGISNLGQPCRRHHRLKHTTTWTPVNATRDEPPGWISPTGRSYPSEQQDWEPPHWPDLTRPADEDHAREDHASEPPHWLAVRLPDWPDHAGEDPDSEPHNWPDWPEWWEWPESPDVSASPGSFGDAEPPLPVDPLPDWAFFTAA